MAANGDSIRWNRFREFTGAEIKWEVTIMTATEEIMVTGEDFIERRILVYPEQTDLGKLQERAYMYGYKRGWVYGLTFGLAFFAVAAILASLVLW
jgi:hypothetical protein